MFLRVIFVSVILGALIIIRFREAHTEISDVQSAPFVLLAVIYLTNIIYVVLIKFYSRIRLQAYFQLLFDTFFITVLIYTTGGIDSFFSFLFILNIISAGIIFSRRGGILIASASSILYGLMLDLHYYGLIHPVESRLHHASNTYNSAFLFYTILVNMVAFYLVGYLSGFLSEQMKRSRAELRETRFDLNKLEILHESIVNSITSGLIVLDEEDHIILFNPTAEEILGIRNSLVSGRSLNSALPDLHEHLRKESKMPPFVDIPYQKTNGVKIYLRLSVSPLRYLSDERGGKILVFQDVTETKRIEESMKRVEGLALVGEMAAGIAHEIRNPMASISGSIEVLKEGNDWDSDSTQKRLMAIVSREIDRLNQLISDFLIFARPKETKWRTFDLNELIKESLTLFRINPRWNKNIRVMTHFIDSVMIESDPALIKQVLWNLFLNACDAMPEGGILEISTKWVVNTPNSTGKNVSIVIRDTGDGFDPITLPKLFTPFFTTKEGGSGLGLATVKRIVDQLRGGISGKNHPESGAEIVITLPIGPGADN